MKIDALDEKLISILRDNARQSSEKVAKRLKVSPTTVRRRMKKLTRSRAVIITTMVDPIKIGFLVQTVIGVDVELGSIESVTEVLVKMPEVKWLSTTTGRFDLLLGASFHTTTELSEFMQKKLAGIKGLKDTEIFVCLEAKKGIYLPT
ncbi:MAG: Lrp/AsnC family transcriptional regulator [Dehalococcoidales bacterium]|nr:Lrp/AsnC family transcriptional regulator [Dehalococcoidales bacterium]